MRRGFLFILVAAVAALLFQESDRIREALAQVEVFRVGEVVVEGTLHLTPEAVGAIAAVPADANLWDDLDPIARRLREYPGILEADVQRRFPGTLRIRVVEREPVAFLPTPALTPVDAEGQLLPIDPAIHRLDLPLLHPVREPARVDAPRLTPAQLRTLAGEVRRLGELDPLVLSSLSEAALDPWGDVLLHLGDPRVTLHYRVPLTSRRLREGLLVLTDALERTPDRRPTRIDLRYADQVVVHFDSPNGR